MRTELLLPICY